MTASAQRILGVAVRCGRLGCVVVDHGDLIIWDGSRSAASSTESAVRKLQCWLDEFRPDVLVTENPDHAGRKRGRQLRILRALVDVGQEAGILNIVIRRQRLYDNVYDEAAAFAEGFPDLAPLLPVQPPIWKKEPYRLIYFEALALIRDAGLLKPNPMQ
ncbi:MULTISPECIES: hypothetical protein [unclassified Mameliella]|uniref:hypothetical protein n=1 Tax=unclassified Mameliella TaxID=2630630 RepID=UPI00273FF693|nr:MULTISPECIES: hypothetical protein [unclassified Mameliella]